MAKQGGVSSAMKVVLVRAHTMNKHINRWAEALAQSGHDVKLLTWDRQRKYPAIESCDSYTWHKFRLKAPWGKLSILFYLPIWWVYEFQFFLKNKPDVIHAFDLNTLIPAVLTKLVRGKTRLCYTVQDFYASLFANAHISIPMLSFVVSAVASLERFLVRYTDILFLVSEYQYEEFKESKVNKIVYIYNSPLEYLNTNPAPKSATEFTIFYGGSIYEGRGLEYMISAVEELDNVKLLIAGLSSDVGAYRPTFTNPNKIHFMAWIPHEEVIERNLNSDLSFCFLNPEPPYNKHTNPNKLYEAMMCGKPIIVNEVGRMGEIVKEEHCGLVVPYGDVTALKEAILRLKNNPELGRKLGENGRRAYESRYSWEIMKGKLTSAYHEIVN